MATVSDLATTVKLHEVQWTERFTELVRRVGLLERDDEKARDRGNSTADQRQMMSAMFVMQAAFTVMMFIVSLLVAHAWR